MFQVEYWYEVWNELLSIAMYQYLKVLYEEMSITTKSQATMWLFKCNKRVENPYIQIVPLV